MIEWLRARFFGVTFFILGGLLAGFAVYRGGLWFWLLWPAFSLLAAAAAYLWLGPFVFGKSPAGTRHWVSRVILMPYCGANWFGWRLLRFVVKEDCWNVAAPGIYIGRRAYHHELPGDVDVIVDLTAEFIEPREIRTGRSYRSLPILDASIPHRDEDLLKLVRDLAESRDVIYIHCAEGHGRAALVAALVLIHRGLAVDAETALEQLKSARPRINLRPHQQLALERLTKRLLEQVEVRVE